MFDMYGQRVELNLSGATSINTLIGSIVSLSIYTIVCAYFLYRFQVLVTYGDTQVLQSTYHHYFNETSSFDLDDKNFKIEPDLSGGSNMVELVTGPLDYYDENTI